MNLLYIGYWSFHDGLTQSTILPHLKILSELPKVKKVVFTTIERDRNNPPFTLNIPKVIHCPLQSKNLPINLLNKFFDFLYFPHLVLKLLQDYSIDKIICRGAPAGALGYLVWKKTGIPYYVESFEPHADYMLESGVWKHSDPRYLMQKRWERLQKKTASGLMPVAENYKTQLLNEGIDGEKVITVPCSVNSEKFIFDRDSRTQIRKEIGIHPRDIVGIYLGKFGGIYYDREAFTLFKEAFSSFKTFFLIILSPDEKAGIISRLYSAGINNRFYVAKVNHNEVPQWLSAADFAFAPIKPAKSRKYCSPIKTGEYWANGLPVLMPDGIGDDSEIIKKEGGGAILRWDDLSASFREIENIIAKPGHREQIPNLAKKYRNPTAAEEAYSRFLTS